MTKDARALPHNVLESLRMQAAEEFVKGTPVEQICAMFDLHRTTVFAWKHNWRAGGVESLAAKPISGRPPKLTDAQIGSLAGLVTDHTPRDYGFAEALWTRALIGELIQQQFGVRFLPDWVGKLMRRVGFAPHRPAHHATRQDSARITAWRQEQYPAIRVEAARVGATVYFGNETHLRWDSQTDSGRTPGAADAGIEAVAEGERATMVSAIRQRGLIHFSVFSGLGNLDRFIDFCRDLLTDGSGSVYLILEDSPIHRAARQHRVVAGSGGRLNLFLLPRY